MIAGRMIKAARTPSDTASLLSTEGNSAPAGATVAFVSTRDGVQLRMATWPGLGNRSRGTVLILQGRAEFIEKYFEVVGELLERGYAVVTFDWRGQGRSDRALADKAHGHVAHFADFKHDYEAVVGALGAGVWPRPWVALAHSMGGCIALTGCLDGWLKVDRLVLSSPMVGLSLVKRPGVVRRLARALTFLGLGTRMVPGGQIRSISTLPFEGNRLSSDPGRYARNAAVATALDWGAIGSPTIGWLTAAYEAMDRLAAPGAAGAVTAPTLVVAGDSDPICSTPAIQAFAHALTQGTLVTVEGARHEVLMERDAMREAFWTAFDAFMAGETHPADALELSA